jgi:hypothetical protein
MLAEPRALVNGRAVPLPQEFGGLTLWLISAERGDGSPIEKAA